MSSYVTGSTIKSLREKKGYTQKQLADILNVSDKTVSKWETERGLPDISLIEDLAKALGVSLAELLSGSPIENRNKSANIKKLKFYACPVCGNIITSTGEGAFSCCGISLPALEIEESDVAHTAKVEKIDNEYYVELSHPMTKSHYISFIAQVTSDRVHIVKLYPEQSASVCLPIVGGGYIYAYCNRHGLFRVK